MGANNYSPLQNVGHINWYALSDSRIAELQEIAGRNTGRASEMAKGVLCFFHGICYEDVFYSKIKTENIQKSTFRPVLANDVCRWLVPRVDLAASRMDTSSPPPMETDLTYYPCLTAHTILRQFMVRFTVPRTTGGFISEIHPTKFFW